MPKLPFKSGQIHFEYLHNEAAEVPTLVLLHGFMEDSRMWNELIPSWRKAGDVLCIDLPGHGKSDSFDTVHSMELMAEVVWFVCKNLNLQNIALLGHSMGGYVALAFAEKYPELLGKFGLFFSTPLADSPERQLMRDKASQLVQQNKNSFVRASIPQLFDPEMRMKFKEEINEQITQSLELSTQGIVAAIQGMKNRPDRSNILTHPPKHLVPNDMIVIAGQADTVIPFESVERWWSWPAIGLRYASPSGHMGHITNRQSCIEAVERWWLG